MLLTSFLTFKRLRQPSTFTMALDGFLLLKKTLYFPQETIYNETCDEIYDKTHNETYDEVHDETYDEVHEEMYEMHKEQNLVKINGPLSHINKAIIFAIDDTFSN
ncbi:25585_t:CDS:2 [Gigaspora margarita]|uniref:25585_t:CDS:1 n=1 Tax=Gigaspora margarita TaxID=4874 RepID=A0ABN7VNR3_GIGMA|nr:25585_t:CDS:2 [Gigaspora margarita]